MVYIYQILLIILKIFLYLNVSVFVIHPGIFIILLFYSYKLF